MIIPQSRHRCADTSEAMRGLSLFQARSSRRASGRWGRGISRTPRESDVRRIVIVLLAALVGVGIALAALHAGRVAEAAHAVNIVAEVRQLS